MYPHESTYPFFEANQVLKKDDLNNLFEYLDEQNRMTRTNLIGIGIVCGMDVIPVAPAAIRITRGVGVTSEGYLVSVPEVEYANYSIYPPNKDIFLGDDCYSELHQAGQNKLHKLVEGLSPDNNQLFELVEGTPAGSTALTAAFLADKVVLIYVELSKNGLKNCSPNSCDDKGSEIAVQFRRFLVTKANADLIKKEAVELVGTQSELDIEQIVEAKILLPAIRLKRFDVPNSNPVTTGDIIAAYRKILTKSFIEDTLRANLVKLFEVYEAILTGLDKTIIQNWTGVYDGLSVKFPRPYEYQYFYDLVSDLIQNYEEIRAKGLEVLALCNPDCRMFPRHLFLGAATIDTTQNRDVYRQYFIPSPIIGNQKKAGEELKLLFARMLTLIERYKIPQPARLEIKGRLFDANIRITPSKLGDWALSQKAIPYYYEVNAGTPKLYETWRYDLKKQGKEKQNLSYHADLYANPADDFVLNPLGYDLEPYNFLRVEGIVGKPYQDVLAAMNQYIRQQRLPFDVVALSTGNEPLQIEMDMADFECHAADLEVLYDVQRTEFRCLISEMKDNRRFDALVGLFPANLAQVTNEAYAEIRRVVDAFDFTEAESVECKVRILIGLITVYRRRLEKLRSNFLFSNYTRNNPGIQHKAGVPVGGTFVIVYHGNIKSHYSPRDPIGIREIAAERPTRVNATAEALPEIEVVAKTASGDANVLGLSEKMLSEISVLPAGIREELVKVLGDRLAGIFNQNEDVGIEVGTVFADFFLPYRCCTDCTPVQVVTPPKNDPLTATVSGPKCDENNKNFTVTITISGGTPPYTSDAGPVTGNTLTVTLTTGSTQNASIKDAGGQEISITIPAHTCGCDLPCDGLAERCFYPVWINKPAKGAMITQKSVEVAKLTVVDRENGTSFDIDFREEFQSIFAQFDDTTYAGAVRSLLKAINTKIREKTGGKNHFILGFDRTNDLMAIEHYICHDFTIELVWQYSVGRRVNITSSAMYNEKSWNIKNDLWSVEGAKFGCFALDKCADKEEELCKEPIKPESIRLSFDKAENVFHYNCESEVEPDFVLWIFETETPEYSNSKSGKFSSRQDSVNVKLVFVLGACFVIVEATVPNA